MSKSTADKIFDDVLNSQINVLRLSETEQIKAEKLLVNVREQILRELVNNDPLAVKRTAWQRARLEKIYKQVDNILKESFNNQGESIQGALTDTGEYVAKDTIDTVNKAIGIDVMGYDLSTKRIQSIVSESMIEGKLMSTWWNDLPKDFTKRFKDVINNILKDFQMGMLQGQALGSMITALAPQGALMGYTRRNIEAMIRTSFMQVAADVRQDVYKQNKDILTGIKWVSTLDRRTTPLCRALDGTIWDMDKNTIKGTMPYHTPPAHWNCFIDHGVPIFTSKGSKRIIDIVVGDRVLTHRGRFRKVTELFRTYKQKPDAVKIWFDNTFLTITEDHPLLVNGDWIRAKDVKVSDTVKRILENHKGEYYFIDAEIKKIENFRVKNSRTLYNFSVEEDESYVAKGVIVHNCRSTTIPVTLPYEEMVKHRPELKKLSTDKRAAMDGPVSKDMDYNTWLKSLSPEVQKDILGVARYKLWKKGNLSMSDMIKTDGNPLTIDKLKKKIENMQ